MRTDTFTIEVQFSEWSDIIDRKLRQLELTHGEILPGLIVHRINNIPNKPNEITQEHKSVGVNYGGPKDSGYMEFDGNKMNNMPNITL